MLTKVTLLISNIIHFKMFNDCMNIFMSGNLFRKDQNPNRLDNISSQFIKYLSTR